MNRRTRVLLAIGLTVILAGAALTFTAMRLKHWDESGIAGISYLPHTKGKRPVIFGMKPGAVLLVYPDGGAEQAGIRMRDEVLSIGGADLKDRAALRAIDARARTGDTVVYRVRRGGTVRDVPVKIVSLLRSVIFLAQVLVSTIVGLAFVAIGLLVMTRNPEDRRAIVFYAMTLVGAISLFVAPALLLDGSNIRGIVADSQQNVVTVCALFIFSLAFLPLTLHLALIFPRDRPILRSSPRTLRWVYGIPVTCVVAITVLILITVASESGKATVDALDLPLNILAAAIALGGMFAAWWVVRTSRGEPLWRAFWNRPVAALFAFAGALFGIARIADALDWKIAALVAGFAAPIVPFLIMAAFPILACVSLYRSYRDAGTEERRQVKWPLWGTLIAIATKVVMLAVVELSSLMLMFRHDEMITWMRTAQVLRLIPTIVYLLIPLSFAFAILKYRLMNIDVIIRKTVVYAFLTGAIVLMYLVLVGGLGTLLVNVAGVKNQTTVIASTLVVALLFVPLRNKLQTLVDRNLFRHRYEYPEALKAISAETLGANDLGAFLGSAAEKIQRALQNGAVVIFVQRHDELVAAAKVGVADSVVGTVRMARAPFVPLLDRPFDPRAQALPDDAAAALKRIEAVLIVPINTPGTPANGFIALAAKLTRADFDAEDIAFLRSVADQIDIGLDRIRQQREEADYEQARGIQQSLLPREMPRVPGLELSGIWQPARTMGGDYYDLLQLGEHEIAVCIGDVAGKGMPAALLMSGLQAAVRASASDSPRDLCERVRRVVVSSLSGGRFVTFFYATIDTAAMRLRWCNAGHNAPVLARADGTTVRLAEGGPAFSRLFRDDRYEEKEIAIGAGDRLVLFTDGVSEAAGGDGEMFGEGRLEELIAGRRELGARELQNHIVDAATAHSGGELDDDLTLVVVAIH